MSFDYEKSVWGNGTASLKIQDPTSIRLKNALNAIKDFPENARILEFGCGAGQFIRAIKKNHPQFECYGFDISQTAVESAKRMNDGVQYIYNEMGKLPFANGYFDAVIILDVLEHVADPNSLIEQAGAVLKVGGIMYLFVPCEGDVLSIWNLLRKFNVGKDLTRIYAGHVQYFKRKDVEGLIEGNNIQIIKKRFSEHLIGQLLGIFAFFGMEKFSKNRGGQINNETFFKESKVGKLVFLKNLINSLVYAETFLFWFIPSPNVHILAKKIR